MSRRDSCPLDCKVYVGELGTSGDKRELEEAFGYYGKLRNVWVARSPPGFAFVEFEDPRDARDAVHALDGRTICGRRVRVELSSGKSRHQGGGRYGGGGGGGGGGRSGGGNRPFNPADRCYDCGERGHYARACHESRGRRRSRSRSRSPRRDSRSRSRSPRRDSRSRSRSRSGGRSRSASPRSNGK